MQTGEYPYDASALLNPLYKCNISLSCGKICWPAQTTSDQTNHQLGIHMDTMTFLPEKFISDHQCFDCIDFICPFYMLYPEEQGSR